MTRLFDPWAQAWISSKHHFLCFQQNILYCFSKPVLPVCFPYQFIWIAPCLEDKKTCLSNQSVCCGATSFHAPMRASPPHHPLAWSKQVPWKHGIVRGPSLLFCMIVSVSLGTPPFMVGSQCPGPHWWRRLQSIGVITAAPHYTLQSCGIWP